MSSQKQLDYIKKSFNFITNKGYNNDEFLLETAKFLSSLFNVNHVIIDTFSEGTPNKVKTLILYRNNEFSESVEYDLEGTPCETILKKEFCFYPKNLQSLFPKDHYLKENNIESYAGISLMDFKGKPIGLLALLDAKPLKNKDLVKSILEIFSLKLEKLLEGYLYDSIIENQIKSLQESNSIISINEQKFKKLSDLSFESIVIHKDGYAIDINLTFEKMFGYTRKEIIGKDIITLLFDKKYRPLIDKNRRNAHTIPFEIEALRKDGSIFPVEIEAKSIDDNNKGIRVASIRDITKRKMELLENKKLSTAVEQSSNTIVITDVNGIIEYVNPKFTEITGYTFNESVGQSPRILNSGQQHNGFYENLWNTIQLGETWHGQFKNISKKGNVFWEQATITPILNNKGEIINYLAIKEDITERKEAEKKLELAYNKIKENENYLTNILKTANEGFWIINTKAITIEVNNKLCEILGMSEEDILGKSIFDFVDDENAAIFHNQLKIREEGIATSYEINLLNSNGKNIPCLFKTSPIINNENIQIGSFALVTNISRIKKAYNNLELKNKELQAISFELSEKNRLLFETKNRFRTLFEKSPVALFEEDYSKVNELLSHKKDEVGDLDSYLDQNPEFLKKCIYAIKLISVNNSTLELFKVSGQEELMNILRKNLNKEALRMLKKEILAVFNNNSSFSDFTEYIVADNSTISTMIQLEKIDESGKVIVSLTDITSLKKAEIKLKKVKQIVEKSEKKFRELFEKSSDAILIIKNGIFIDCNKATIEMLNYKSKEDFLNTHPSKLSPSVQPDGKESFEKANEMINVAFEKGTNRFEWMHLKENDELFLVEVLLTAISNEPNNKILHCVWRDITQRKEDEDKLNKQYFELKKAKEKIEESDKLKTEFINNMSHEIRTPMNGILGFSELLKNSELSYAKRKYFINIIQNSGKQLLHVIDDILEISRLGTKQVKFNKEEVCLNELMFELFSIFDIKAKENKTPLYLKNGLSEEESIVYTDRSKLIKILSNLLENALKFTNKGFINFGYLLKNTQLEIFVQDSGIGIHPEKQEIIFDRFSQGNKQLTRNSSGLGLGLSIAKENTEIIGGNLVVKSKLGEGSIFTVTIPYDPIKRKFNSLENRNEEQGYCKNRTILIAEDEEINYLFLEILIREKLSIKCEILHAKDGQEAINICQEREDINIVLMDINMPILNGYDATKQIRKLRPNLPIIAQTAYSTSEDKNKALKAGCDNFISKPIRKEVLQNVFKKYMKQPKIGTTNN